jgi:tRNA dimethylallyltransferase
VAGPTGSGKTDLALELAETCKGEIVNCDSVQLYRYLNIGSAKTPLAERRGIPHHLVDIINPDQIFTAGDYQRAGRSALREITGRGGAAVVVGGTGFYLRALLNGIFEGPGRDDQLRARLSKRRPGSLHRLLKRFDPAAAERIHPNDTQKLIRALEVCLLARKPITSLHSHNRLALEGFNIIRIGLDPPRDALTHRIHVRCEHMFQAGLVDETRAILAMGFPRGSKALESIGYRASLLHIEGQLSFADAIQRTQIATRQYAKRQRTWFRRELGFHWLPSFGNQNQTVEEAKRLVSSFEINNK